MLAGFAGNMVRSPPMKTPARSRKRHVLGPALRFVCCTGVALLLAACKNDAERASSSSAEASARAPSSAAPSGPSQSASPAAVLEQPITLLELDESAYRATLRFDDEALYLLTETAAYRFAPGKEPLRMPLDLGAGPALTSSSIVFWSKGALLAAPKSGGTPRILAKLPRQPQVIVAAEDRFAWLERDDAGKYSIVTLVGGKPRVSYAPKGAIAAITMLDGEAFFVEVAPDDSWRIGGVSLDGGEPRFTKPRTGRSPSMLYGRRDLFYYDGPRRSVLRSSPDLENEEVIAEKLICSPITVGERVVCAQVGGIFDVPLDSRGAPRRLAGNPGFITAIAANSSSVAWLKDNGKSGEDKLALRLIPLPSSVAAEAPTAK